MSSKSAVAWALQKSTVDQMCQLVASHPAQQVLKSMQYASENPRGSVLGLETGKLVPEKNCVHSMKSESCNDPRQNEMYSALKFKGQVWGKNCLNFRNGNLKTIQLTAFMCPDTQIWSVPRDLSTPPNPQTTSKGVSDADGGRNGVQHGASKSKRYPCCKIPPAFIAAKPDACAGVRSL